MMKRFATALIILLLAVGLVYAKDYMVMKKAGSYTVEVKLDKNPPITGQNKMEISIKDDKGGNVTDAAVVVDYSMPAMPGMPAMNYKTKAELSGSRYLANVNFSMSGAWAVNIKITRAGKTQSVKLNVDVS
ncbi:MAG: FixH family protein [Deltaproteobacteria bacterium]|nr:FixH family protein [Deltaproteobacteria bacterium]